MRSLSWFVLAAALAAACGDAADDRIDPVPMPMPMPMPVPVLTRTDAATAAECPDGGTVLRSGPDVDGDGILDDDEVTAAMPMCRGAVVTGDVHVTSQAELDALRGVRKIGGALFIERTGLTAVELPALREVDAIHIADNDALTRVAMPSLQSVAGALELVRDPALSGLALPSLTYVMGELIVERTQLASLTAFDAVRAIDGGLLVRDNPALLAAQLPAIRRITVMITFERNPKLIAVDLALETTPDDPGALQSIMVISSERLESVVLSLGGERRELVVVIDEDPTLSRVRIRAGSLRQVSIDFSKQLEDVEIDAAVTGEAYIQGAALRRLVVTGRVGQLDVGGPLRELALPPSVLDLTLRRTALTALVTPLELDRLILTDNPSLERVELQRIKRSFELASNPRLARFTVREPSPKLDKATIVSSAIEQLDLSAWAAIDELEVRDARALTTIAKLGPTTLGVVTLRDLPALAELGLDRVTSAGDVVVERTGLEVWSGLSALQSVTSLTVTGNDALDLVALPLLGRAGALTFTKNRRLAACAIDALFARVIASSKIARDNDDGATCE